MDISIKKAFTFLEIPTGNGIQIHIFIEWEVVKM